MIATNVPPSRDAAGQRPGDAANRDARRHADRLDRQPRVGCRQPEARREAAPQEDRGKAGEPGHQPDQRFERPAAVALPDDGDKKGGGDDVAEAEQAVSEDELRERRAAGSAGSAPAPLTGGPRSIKGDGDEAGERKGGGPEPARLPGGSRQDETPSSPRRPQCPARRRKNAAPAGRCAGGRQVAEDDAGQKDHDEGAGEPGEKADGEEQPASFRSGPSAAASSVLAARPASISARSRPAPSRPRRAARRRGSRDSWPTR